jgi:hypothetical protein
MAYEQYLRPSFLESLGQKVKQGVDMFGKAQGLYETGKALFSAYESVVPMISQAAAFVPYVFKISQVKYIMFQNLNCGKHFNNVNIFIGQGYHHGKRFLGHLENAYRTGNEIYQIIEPALQHVAPETTGHTNRHLNKMDSN